MNTIGKSTSEVGEATVLSRRTATAELPRVTVVLRWTIGIVGVALLAWFYDQRPPVSLRYFWVYTGAFVVLQLFLAIRIAPSARFHLGFIFLIAYFQLVGGVAAATLISVDRIVTWIVRRLRRERDETLLSLFFDIGLHVLSALSGALMVTIFLQLPAMELSVGVKPLVAMLLFSGGFFLAHSTLTSVAVYSRFGFSDLRTRLWPVTVLWTGISILGSLPLAIITWNLIGAFGEPWAALIMLSLAAAVSLILKLNDGLMKINREQKALNTIGNLLNSTLSTRELFTIIATETRQVLGWNRFFIALTNQEELIDLVFVDASGSQTSTRTVPKGIGLTGRAMVTGEVVHYEAERGSEERMEDFETSTGRRRPRSVVVAPMRFGDSVIGAIGLQSFRPDSYGPWHFRLLETIAAQSATAIRNAQLYESERLANQERDEFVSVVTHEIKSPLTSISGYADLARRSIETGDRDGAVESLDVVKSESRKILRLVEDLLDASNIDAGRFSLELGSVDLEPIITEIIER
ncbi:MAG: GAF domain-containing protein, partial [Acidobacteria bacterium]|nr:GAF domain-containing protein [Acidobacteriota bacterium]